jgi:MYXO-CTERM domain-containing protein
LTTSIGGATLFVLLLNQTTRLSRLVLIVAVFLIWTPVAHAWSWPVHGPVLEPFAYDEAHPYASGQHRGIDIGADAAGENVVAPAAGTVSFAGTVPTSGRSVTIETADGYSVTLTHLGTILVAKGATVAEQDPVGTVGPSGTPEVDAPYVHLGIRLAADANGYVDPLSLLPAVGESGASQSDSPATQPSTSSGSAATTPEPAPAPAGTPTTRGSTVTPTATSHSHHARVRGQRPRVELQAQRSVLRPARSGRTTKQRARTLHRDLRRPVTSSQPPVVEATAHRPPTGLDAGHQWRPSVDTTAQPPSSPGEAPAVPLPLICNGVAALVALAAALAAARRRRRDTSVSASAQVLQLPRRALHRHERRAA